MSENSFEARLKTYFAFVESCPELFVNPEGGVRILLDPAEIAKVEKAKSIDLVCRGFPEAGAHVGVALHDPWVTVIRDAVEFADGSCRLHTRVVSRIRSGSAVLPVFNGKIVLIRHFRHALRRTILEIPRGGVEPGQSPEETAHTEIREEIGGTIQHLTAIGFLYGTTNIVNNGAHLFFAELASVGVPQVGEGIESIEQFSVAEFEDLLRRGEIVEGFTVAAYAHAKLLKLI